MKSEIVFILIVAAVTIYAFATPSHGPQHDAVGLVAGIVTAAVVLGVWISADRKGRKKK